MTRSTRPSTQSATAAARGPSLVTNTARSPHVRLRALPFGAVQWTDGFWADRFRLCHEVMVPTMRTIMEGTDHSQFLQNLKIAAGLAEGRHRGPKWNDGDFYKWLEGAIATYAITRDAGLDAAVDEVVAVIAKAQRPDGYLHTPQIIDWRAGGKLPAFADPMDFEMYNMGHLITAGVVHHRATGKDDLLKVATRAADCIDRTFAHPTPAVARHGICPSHLMGIIELYRETGHLPYRDLAMRLLDMRDLVVGGDDDNQDRVPFRKQVHATGHAVRATYLYAGAADIYAEAGDESLVPPLRAIWADAVGTKLYVTGGCGALFDGASPDGSADQQHITRVHQAFGRPFQLPHATAHNETCAAIGNVLWNWRMLQITGDPRCADVIEQTLLNTALAGMDLGGTEFFYTNALRRLDPMPVELRWNRTRRPFVSCFCCPPNLLRTLAESPGYACLASDRGVYAVLYGACGVAHELADGTTVRFRQETDYPWDGTVRFAIDSGGTWSLFLRIPGWAGGATVSVNGEAAEGRVEAGTFHEVRRAWRPGDTVELRLPMSVRLVEAHPYVEEARNQAAVMRGPVVYCLESPDLPEGARVMDVRLPIETQFALAPLPRLGDVRALRASLQVTDTTQGWDGALYRDLVASRRRRAEVTFIPYFAWDNRGPSEMTVWVPVT